MRVSNPVFVASTWRDSRVCDFRVFIFSPPGSFSLLYIERVYALVTWIPEIRDFTVFSEDLGECSRFPFGLSRFVESTCICIMYLYLFHLTTEVLSPDMLLLDTCPWYVNFYHLSLVMTWLVTYHLPEHLSLACYTWYLTPDIWHLTVDMPSPGTNTLDLILWHLTGYCYTWHPYYIAYSWLSVLRELGMIIILLPDFWYSWTPVLLNSCIPELL